MEWTGEGVLISNRRHGENAAIIEVFTRDRGRTAGLVRGGSGRRLSPILQPGAQLAVSWRARLEEHLGTFTVEPIKSRSAQAMSDRLSLAALSAFCALTSEFLPEQDPHARLYDLGLQYLDAMEQGGLWHRDYIGWEIALLTELGFGIDLNECAATGVEDDLIYVSPKTGRAVCRSAGAPYHDRLLPLPAFLLDGSEPSSHDLAAALKMTSYFLSRWAAPALNKADIPAARQRLYDTAYGLASRENK